MPRPRPVLRQRFHGQIAGVGTSSGTRIVVGRWLDSPFGTFADAMIERPDGHRILIAPTHEVAQYICDTYTFDETRLEPVILDVDGGRWFFESASLLLSATIGRRTGIGWLLRAVPPRMAASPAWSRAISPIAGRIVRGVQTVGTARMGRVEYYGASDNRRIVRASATLDGIHLGDLRPVDPPCRFGFSSTPRTPGVTDVTTTVDTPGHGRRKRPERRRGESGRDPGRTIEGGRSRGR